MQNHENPLFTPTEAAVLTHLSLKAVNNAIDKKTIQAITGRQAGQVIRLLDLRALMFLTLERRLTDRFVPTLRREVFKALGASSRDRVSLEGGFLTIDLKEPRRELAISLRQLRRARHLVVIDPEIMGGDPVFRGTRVPVHSVAAQVEQGASTEELLADYPRLTADMIVLASVYAAAYPARGRPRVQPWHSQTPICTSRTPLATIEAG